MKFYYIARTADGKNQSGEIDAIDKARAIDALQKNNLIIISLRSKLNVSFFAKEIKLFRSVKNKDLVIFSRQLSILFSAKIPLVESLRTTSKQSPNKYFQEILQKIAVDIEAGMLFSKALEKYPKIFSSFYINMVKSGEVSGTLENVLNYLADYLEKQFYLTSKVAGAMIYPGVVLTGFLIAGALMMTLVIPQLTQVLKETGQVLPWTTQLVIFVSDVIRKFGWLILLLAMFIIAGAIYYIQNYASGRKTWDTFKLQAPIIGTIFSKLYLSRLSDTLSTLIAGGIPILQSLQVSADIVDNVILKKIIIEAKDEARVGNTISSVFEKHKEIPPMVTNMLAVGEQTGTIDSVLKKLADFYTKEVDNMVSNLSQLIEPLLILVLGIGVALLVVSVFMPIYNVAQGF